MWRNVIRNLQKVKNFSSLKILIRFIAEARFSPFAQIKTSHGLCIFPTLFFLFYFFYFAYIAYRLHLPWLVEFVICKYKGYKREKVKKTYFSQRLLLHSLNVVGYCSTVDRERFFRFYFLFIVFGCSCCFLLIPTVVELLAGNFQI